MSPRLGRDQVGRGAGVEGFEVGDRHVEDRRARLGRVVRAVRREHDVVELGERVARGQGFFHIDVDAGGGDMARTSLPSQYRTVRPEDADHQSRKVPARWTRCARSRAV